MSMTMKLDGWDTLQKKLSNLGADIIKEQKNALIEARDKTNNSLRSYIKANHYDTGELYNSIVDYPPKETENGVTITAGFDFDKGGWKSRFLLAGTPKQAKDTTLWGMFYSEGAKQARKNIMIQYLNKVVKILGG